MRFHASCAARVGEDGLVDAVLLCGASGSGKSDFLLRLIQHGFALVADDQVIVAGGIASAPPALAGILEVRGLGLFRLPFIAAAPLRLVVRLGFAPVRLPVPELDRQLDLPVVTIDPAAASAPARLMLALDAACGRAAQIAGAFAA
jgi:HPr kinase/phosphorylase